MNFWQAQEQLDLLPVLLVTLRNVTAYMHIFKVPVSGEEAIR
jgi:hypothetical protein